jgi:beta-N-acetylhexosaminidase
MSRVFGLALCAFTALALAASAQTPAPDDGAPAPAASPSVPKPRIVSKPIPFGSKRRRQMRRYAVRHYGMRTFRLRDPKVVVIHYTASSTFSSAYNTFAANRPDVELGELPGVCAHFVVDSDGTLYQLVPLSIMCRHTVGLNWTSIGIEHVGTSDGQVLGRRAQMRASIRLTRWLRCRFGIGIRNVIGHNESLKSRYHRERVARLRKQTHGDFPTRYAKRYRARLRRAGDC